MLSNRAPGPESSEPLLEAVGRVGPAQRVLAMGGLPSTRPQQHLKAVVMTSLASLFQAQGLQALLFSLMISLGAVEAAHVLLWGVMPG